MRIKSIKEVVNSNLCNGCGVCCYLFPRNLKMENVFKYGMRPQYLNSDLNELTALDACQGIHLRRPDSDRSANIINKLKPTWGNILSIWKGYSTSKEIRFKSSSGGLATAISLCCIDKLNYSGVFHLKKNRSYPNLNEADISKDKEALLSSTGSIYAPSSLCAHLGSIEKSKGEFVFIGKPCDIAALNKILEFKPELDKKIKLAISIFCAGVPSQEGTGLMLKKMGVTEGDIVKSIKYRGDGWPGKAAVTFINNEKELITKELAYKYAWGQILQKTRPWRCRICPDHTGELADISVGDLWNHEYDENDIGQSIVLIRTKRGEDIFKEVIENNYLHVSKATNESLEKSQPNLKETRSTIWGRLIAMKISGLPLPVFEELNLFQCWLINLTLKQKLKSILSTLKRIHVKKLWRGEI